MAALASFSSTLQIGIVGGSLVGLAAATALARAGLHVTVFERDSEFLAGTGLGVSPDLLSAVSGRDPRRDFTELRRLPMIRTHRYTTAWNLLHHWLRTAAGAHATVQIRFGQKVSSVQQDLNSATVVTEHGDAHSFDCILGADGYRSTVRSQVEPRGAEPNYLGALIWRGTCAEADLSTEVDHRSSPGHGRHNDPRTLRLVAYPIPGLDGTTRPGFRRLNWAWYDSTRLSLMEQLRCVAEGRVLRSAQNWQLQSVRAELIDLALSHWNSPWRECIQETLKTDSWFATPLAAYLPSRLISGRIALIGDAAHVAPPITGAGFTTGLEDVSSIVRLLGGSSHPGEIPNKLQQYEKERLQASRHLVLSGQRQVRSLIGSHSTDRN